MNKLPVGLQLYGVRDLLENNPENFASVMREIKTLSYDGVELAGLYGLPPAEVRDILQTIGLTPISAHVALSALIEDPLQAAKDYKLIGCQYVVVPYLPEAFRHNTQGYAQVIGELKHIGTVMKENGLKLLYHNHDFELVMLDSGLLGLDDLYRQVAPDLLMAEPDTCWLKVGNLDPAVFIARHGSRCEIVHLKDFIMEGNPQNLYKLIGLTEEESREDQGMFTFQPVGFGQQIWEPILDATLAAGTKWVIVEQDEHDGLGSLEAARRSREYLRILGW